jgi:hypothetical protein
VRHELRTADGEVVWKGSLDRYDDVRDLWTLLANFRNRAHVRERRAGRIAIGLCGQCGSYRIAKGHKSLCENCREEHRADNRERYRRGR